MKQYSQTEEDNVRAEKLVREWERSGLIDNVQAERMNADLKTGLRRTNNFLRLVLFVFGLAIAGASVLLISSWLNLDDEGSFSVLSIAGAIASFGCSDYLTRRFRLYRFGIEEALAVASVVLIGLGAALAVDAGAFVGLTVASGAAFLVYKRLGYIYAGAGTILCLCLACFELDYAFATGRLLVMIILAAALILLRAGQVKSLQAMTWAGLYVAANLQLIEPRLSSTVPPAFYWFTYALIWVLPIAGLYVSVRKKDRPILDVSLAMALATLMTNKRYLGFAQQTWDPILFGVLLIGTAVVVRRYLASGTGGWRHGFTSNRLLDVDLRALSFVGTASAVIQPGTPSTDQKPEGFKSGGGRSGGAGASGNY